jgi:hypothetical protein
MSFTSASYLIWESRRLRLIPSPPIGNNFKVVVTITGKTPQQVFSHGRNGRRVDAHLRSQLRSNYAGSTASTRRPINLVTSAGILHHEEACALDGEVHVVARAFQATLAEIEMAAAQNAVIVGGRFRVDIGRPAAFASTELKTLCWARYPLVLLLARLLATTSRDWLWAISAVHAA